VFKALAILSTYAVDLPHYVPVGGFGIFGVRTRIGGRQHRLVTLRFDWKEAAANERGHEAAADLVLSYDRNDAIILGGDFNFGGAGTEASFREFIRRTELTRCGSVEITKDGPIDNLFIRGPYTVTQAVYREPPPERLSA
jgi:hypothetical protein